MKSDKNIDGILQALETSQKAKPSSEFLRKMEELAISYTAKINSFSKQTLIGIAASFLLLLVANVYTINQSQSQSEIEVEESELDNYNLVPTKSLY